MSISEKTPASDLGEAGDVVKAPEERMIYCNVRGVWLHLPFVYLEDWRHQNKSGRFAAVPSSDERWVRDALPFDFWMPSSRWIENTEGQDPTSFRPREKGREIPGPSEFIVRASLEYPWIQPPPSDDFLTPQEMINNGAKGGLTDASRYIHEYELTNYDLIHKDYFQTHAYNKKDLQLMIICILEDHATNPICVATAWWPQEKLGMRLLFPTDQVRHWRGVVDNARSLAEGWTIPRRR